VDEHLARVHARLRGDRLAGVLGRAAARVSKHSLAPAHACATARERRATHESSRVLGRWKLVFLRILRTLCELTFKSR
jgi:hypothetical protein